MVLQTRSDAKTFMHQGFIETEWKDMGAFFHQIGVQRANALKRFLKTLAFVVDFQETGDGNYVILTGRAFDSTTKQQAETIMSYIDGGKYDNLF